MKQLEVIEIYIVNNLQKRKMKLQKSKEGNLIIKNMQKI
jgi:hypothetical protein